MAMITLYSRTGAADRDGHSLLWENPQGPIVTFIYRGKRVSFPGKMEDEQTTFKMIRDACWYYVAEKIMGRADGDSICKRMKKCGDLTRPTGN